MKTLEEQLEEAKKERNWFCPQINTVCEHRCYCYVGPKIIKGGTDTNGVTIGDRLQGAYCTHLLHQEQPTLNIYVNNY